MGFSLVQMCISGLSHSHKQCKLRICSSQFTIHLIPMPQQVQILKMLSNWYVHICSCLRIMFKCICENTLLTTLLQGFPLSKFSLQVIFEVCKLTAEVPSATPTDQVTLEITLSSRMPPHIILCQRKLFHTDQKRCCKAVIMFPVLHTSTISVNGKNVDMKVIHGWMSMDPRHDLLFPNPSGWKIHRLWWRFLFHSFQPEKILSGLSSIFSSKLSSDHFTYFAHLCFNLLQKQLIFECIEWMEEIFWGVPWKEQNVYGRLRV